MGELDVPRLVLGGVASGVGKTTVTVALTRALRARGLSVAVFKCGPDYLDPTWHARAAGRPSHNLDGWMMGREALLRTFQRGARGADIALIEGVMGLFDGADPRGSAGSTAEVASWLQAPVLLVADVSGMARSVAALAQGYADFDPSITVAALIANRVGSRGHLDLLRGTGARPPIAGGLPKQPSLAFPERHLGLHAAALVDDDRIDAWAELATDWLDLDRILAIARAAPPLPAPVEHTTPGRLHRCRIGIARDRGFSFYYDHNLELLQAFGATLVPFSPLADPHPPDVDGLYLGGGYPELHAEALAENRTMRAAIADLASRGAPIYAECGGLMYLSRAIRGLDGRRHPMVGVIPGEAVLCDRLQSLGYVEVELQTDSSLGAAGTRFRGHQFRYSRLQDLAEVEQVYRVRRRRGGAAEPEGYRVGSVLASYVHAHWASNPGIARNLVVSCAASAGGSRSAKTCP